eukprot:scaffold128632_cov23-Attheya_sp.AAC.1
MRNLPWQAKVAAKPAPATHLPMKQHHPMKQKQFTHREREWICWGLLKWQEREGSCHCGLPKS